MKVRGDATLHAPVDRVFDALNDPAVLVRTIPGCERLEETAPGHYRMTVTAGVASIKGTYAGEVALTEQDRPGSFVLKASGSGAPGTIDADVKVSLSDAGDGSTRLEYDADAAVGGVIGGVGQRMLVGVAKKTAGEFFSAVDDVLTGVAPAATPALVSAGAATTAVGAAAAQPAGVYTAPRAAAPPAGEARTFLLGVAVGAAVALAGVVVGGVLGRRTG
jgi:carbon monoxide dehydrogenase subunit G